ncbi:MAG TPA: hypothetical protein VG013_19190 [Gemmataceae bacterium]|nr:hypothetical protein [Gemmataceae bacterium]
MRRHPFLLLAVLAAMIAVAALSARKKPQLLVLEWASKAKAETPPVAVLIEIGLKDSKPTSWSGRAKVSGANVVHREGYRFRDGDRLVGSDAWQASSRRPIALPPRNPAVAIMEGIATVGVVLHLSDVQPDASITLDAGDRKSDKAVVPLKDVLAGRTRRVWDGDAAVRLVSTAMPLVTAKTEDDFPAAAYGPDGTLWLAYISYTVRDESRRIQQAQLRKQPADFKSLYTPEFADQLFVKYYRDGKWSRPMAITGPKEDLMRCAIAVEGNGDAWVVYSADRKGSFDIYARPISKKYSPEAVANPAPRPGPEQRLTTGSGRNLSPVLASDPSGGLLLVCQSLGERAAGLSIFTCHAGKWQQEKMIGRASCWSPAVATGLDGRTAYAFDLYKEGDYDVMARIRDKEGAVTDFAVAGSSRFEARPSVCYDVKGRLWIAYEEGPERWGKDFGALDEDANPLYNTRSVRVVCLQDGKLFKPAAELPTSTSNHKHPDEQTTRYAYPKVGIDGKGRLWLTYRQKFGSRYSTHPGSYWLTFARRLDGDKWTPPIELHHSDGLLDSRPVLLPHPGGGLLVIHNADGRYTSPQTIDNQIYASVVDLPGEPVEPELVAHEPGTKDADQAKEERAAVKRRRDYRVEAGGKTYRLLRGEFHRHTELSWDGGPDGSLEDMFRYAIDAAAMDWIGNTDHDSGAGREYSWWLIQKLTDAYHITGSFTPVFAYERSVNFPHGHRNCVFAQRGVRTLPRLAEPDQTKRVAGIHADDTKMLYRYLHELGGICASHTSATDMGTDWRDNDPEVEPVVEIYQGDRMSYEYQDAPRAGHAPRSGKKPVSIGGWRPAGFVNLAFKKGYRLGFQASSDHWSTHISFCIALAEKHDREGILAALGKRHCYGATDDIIVDVRSGNHIMGDEFKTAQAPALHMTVVGTKALDRIDVLKDSEVVQTIKPGKQEYKGDWTDPTPEEGVHYYYIRVQQRDGQLAWASPMWIDYAK